MSQQMKIKCRGSVILFSWVSKYIAARRGHYKQDTFLVRSKTAGMDVCVCVGGGGNIRHVGTDRATMLRCYLVVTVPRPITHTSPVLRLSNTGIKSAIIHLQLTLTGLTLLTWQSLLPRCLTPRVFLLESQKGSWHGDTVLYLARAKWRLHLAATRHFHFYWTAASILPLQNV
jgi:hypothetical protein